MPRFQNKLLVKHLALNEKSFDLIKGSQSSVLIYDTEYLSGQPGRYMVSNGVTDYDIVSSVKESKIDSPAITMITAPRMYIPDEVRDLINQDKTVYVIMQDDNDVIAETIRNMKEFGEKQKLYQKNRDELEKVVKELSKLKQDRRDLPKEDKEGKKELTKKIEKKVQKEQEIKLVGQSLRDGLKVGFLLNRSADFSMFFKIGRPVYLNKKFGFLVYECKKAHKKASANIQDLNDMISVMDRSEERKEWDSVKEKLSSYMFSSDISVTHKLSHAITSYKPFTQVELPEVSFKRSISMSDAIPTAKVKSSIAAQMLASGSTGRLNVETLIDEEPCNLKSAMVATVSTETVEMNGEKITSTTYGWAPKLGVFNRLRKNFTIYEV